MKSFRAMFSGTAILLFFLFSVGSAQSASTISLVQGWNLISLPVQPANTAIASVLSGLAGSYEVVWAYPNQAWKVYDPNDTAGSTLTTMSAGNGYWIKMTSAKTLSVSGTAPPSSLSLSSGWNLLGYNGTSCVTASTALFSLGSAVQVSWGYSSQDWQFYQPAKSSSTLSQLCPGAGYWINVNQAATWGTGAVTGVAAAIETQVTSLMSLINGASPTAAELDPFFATAFGVNDGADRAQEISIYLAWLLRMQKSGLTLTVTPTNPAVSLVQVSGSTYTVGVTTTFSDGTVYSTNPDGSDNFIFVNEGGTWKLAGNGYLSSFTRNPFRAVSYSVTLPGGSASTVTGLALNVGDDWNQGLQSAVITGPGLPTNGVVISKTAGDTTDLVPVATTTPAYTPYALPLPASYAFIPNTDVYPLTDASINQIPLNAVYTFTIYNVSGTLVETRTKTLPMRPLLSTELAALVTAWPTPLPNVTSHTLASSQVNGTLGFTYTPPPASTFPAVELKGSLQFWDNNGDTAGFPFWNNGSTNVPIPQILPMNVTSAGITSAVSSFTPLAARLDFSAADVFRREVHVQWIFGP